MKAAHLAKALSALVRGKNTKEAQALAEKFISFLSTRGYSALLPRILKEYDVLRAQEEKPQTILTISQASDEKSALKKSGTDTKLAVVIDPSIIGGYVLETNSTRIDASYKGALLNLYQKIK